MVKVKVMVKVRVMAKVRVIAKVRVRVRLTLTLTLLILVGSKRCWSDRCIYQRNSYHANVSKEMFRARNEAEFIVACSDNVS